MGLFRVVLILLTIYFLFKIVFRIVFPLVLKHYVKKHEDNFHSQNHKKEGKINVDYIPKKDKPKSSIDGEYVDYEEVK